jgi:hypothetical protein
VQTDKVARAIIAEERGATRKKTERLRALRLAKDAAEAPPTGEEGPKKARPRSARGTRKK